MDGGVPPLPVPAVAVCALWRAIAPVPSPLAGGMRVVPPPVAVPLVITLCAILFIPLVCSSVIILIRNATRQHHDRQVAIAARYASASACALTAYPIFGANARENGDMH